MSFIFVEVTGTFHWGYSIQSPRSSKGQIPLLLPPPTTLVGALAYPLLRKKPDGPGEVIIDESGKISSSSRKVYDSVVCAAIAFENGESAYAWHDISKLVTIQWHYHRADRRGVPKYETGALPLGKVYSQGKAKIIYVLKKGLHEQEVESSAWQIARIGSKESIFSVENVKISKTEPKKSEEEIKTRFYFPIELVKQDKIGTPHFTQEFWVGGFSSQDLKPKVFVVPGTEAPIESRSIAVRPKKETVYFSSNGDTVLAGLS